MHPSLSATAKPLVKDAVSLHKPTRGLHRPVAAAFLEYDLPTCGLSRLHDVPHWANLLAAALA